VEVGGLKNVSDDPRKPDKKCREGKFKTFFKYGGEKRCTISDGGSNRQKTPSMHWGAGFPTRRPEGKGDVHRRRKSSEGYWGRAYPARLAQDSKETAWVVSANTDANERNAKESSTDGRMVDHATEGWPWHWGRNSIVWAGRIGRRSTDSYFHCAAVTSIEGKELKSIASKGEKNTKGTH